MTDDRAPRTLSRGGFSVSAPLDPVAVTFFADYAAARKNELMLDLDELVLRIRTTSGPAKAGLPWLKMARFGEKKTAKGSLRHDTNMISISGVEADYDGEAMTVDEAHARLRGAGLLALLYTSPSHTEDTPRWRVLCPFSMEYTPDERDRFLARLNGLFGGIFAPESWTLSQSYYFGSINNNPSHRALLLRGTPIDLADELELSAISKPAKPNGAQAPTGPATPPEAITDKRVNGLIQSLLTRIRNAADGEKYFTLRDTAFTIGGYLWATDWSVAQAVEACVAALSSAKDYEAARKTAASAIEAGRDKPLELINRPNPNPRGNGATPPPPVEARDMPRDNPAEPVVPPVDGEPPIPPGGEPPPPDDEGPPPHEDGEPEQSRERFGPPTLADLSVDDLAAMDEIAFGRIAKAKADLLGVAVGALRAARNVAKAAAKAQAKDREQEAKRQAKEQEREGDVAKRRARHARLPDWLKKLARDDTGKPIPDLANAMTALSEAPELRDLLAYDEMARAPVLLAPVPGTKNTETPHPLNDIDVGAIQNWVQRAAIRRLAKDIVHQASELRADQNRFHPVRRYLDALVWDRKPRLDKWLSYYLGVERIRKAAPSGEDYVDAIGRMFLISGVARIFDPGCQCDYMLVLEGTQGNLKSSACAILAGEWFSDHLPDLHTSQKDVSQHLNGKWIVEIPELAALLKADESLIKSFITRRVERYRRSYGRRDVFESRQCVFIGTTNLEAYLRDPTGGRRFWPVKVGVIDLKALKTDRDQLWAEAVVRYRAGEKYWPDAKFEREQIQEQQEARFDEDVWTDPIREHLKGQVQTTVMQMAVALGFTNEEVGTRDQRRISAILERFGWVRHRTGKQRWWVPMGNGRQ